MRYQQSQFIPIPHHDVGYATNKQANSKPGTQRACTRPLLARGARLRFRSNHDSNVEVKMQWWQGGARYGRDRDASCLAPLAAIRKRTL